MYCAEWQTITVFFALDSLDRAQQFEHRKNAGAGFQLSNTEEEHKLWESESHTWLLLETLFRYTSRETFAAIRITSSNKMGQC